MEYAKVELREGWTAEADNNCWTLKNKEGEGKGYYTDFAGALQASFDKGLKDENVRTLDDVRRSIADLYKFIEDQFPEGREDIVKLIKERNTAPAKETEGDLLD